MTQVKDLTIDDFKALLQDTLEETLNQYFDDPEETKTVTIEVRERLEKILYRRQNNISRIPAAEVYQKLGLNQHDLFS